MKFAYERLILLICCQIKENHLTSNKVCYHFWLVSPVHLQESCNDRIMVFVMLLCSALLFQH